MSASELHSVCSFSNTTLRFRFNASGCDVILYRRPMITAYSLRCCREIPSYFIT